MALKGYGDVLLVLALCSSKPIEKAVRAVARPQTFSIAKTKPEDDGPPGTAALPLELCG
jgi:hypothetical protein